MSKESCEIAVIGGGISGLAAAWYLHRGGRDVVLLEKDETVGGCTRTIRQDGFLVEQGPFNVLVRDPSFEALLSDLEDRIEIVEATAGARRRYLYQRGRLVPVPSSPVSLMTTKVISAGAKIRLIGEPIFARRPRLADPTIGDFATRHCGREFAETVVGALVAGIYGGDIDKLSLKACAPTIAEIDRNHRSLLLYGLSLPFRKIGKPKKPRRRWRGMVSVVGGLGAVTKALGEEIGGGVRTLCGVKSIQAGSGGFVVRFEQGGSQEDLHCRRVILATDAARASELLGTADGEPARELASLIGEIKSVPLAVLSLGFRRRDVGHDLQGFGFLVPPSEADFPLMGVLWASSVFPAHAPDDQHLLRIMVGGSRHPDLVGLGDDELSALARRELDGLLQIKGRPTLQHVRRYRRAIPQYFQGHVDRVRRVRDVQSRIPNLHLVGNYLEGVSLNDCVRLAKKTADQILSESA